jgi:hypothetical protein
LAREALRADGIESDRIGSLHGECTACDAGRFHSYRNRPSGALHRRGGSERRGLTRENSGLTLGLFPPSDRPRLCLPTRGNRRSRPL